MRILNQFQPLAIENIEEESFSCAHHAHTYYEMIYIHFGKGTHNFNNQLVEYTEGDLFLVSPGDEHSFKIKTKTYFTYIKFTESYFESKKHLSPDIFNLGTPEVLMKLNYFKEIQLNFKGLYKEILKEIIKNLITFNKLKNINDSPTVYFQLLSIFGLIDEVLKQENIHLDSSRNRDLITYIHENIYERENLKIKNIARIFNISSTYFSNYFNKSYNISYQKYIDNYRATLIKKRLDFQNYSKIKIVEEFGFTDTSHLAKFFKKVTGITMKQYLAKNTSAN